MGWPFRHHRPLFLRRGLAPHQPLLRRRERLPKEGELLLLPLLHGEMEGVAALCGPRLALGYPKGFEKVLSSALARAVAQEAAAPADRESRG